MAILHVDKTVDRGRCVWAGAVLAIGLVVVLAQTDTPGELPAKTTPRAPHDPNACCAISPVQISTEPPLAADATAGAASEQASRLYRTALLYSDCLALAEAAAETAAEPADERYQIDPSGAFAARLAWQEQARRVPCRSIGPYEFRHVDGVMREAARRGDRDAAFFLLDRDLQIAAAAAARDGLTPATLGRAAPLVAQVEALAGAGHAPAMWLAAQLRVSGVLVAPDPVRAAAWTLAAWQVESGHPPSDDELGNTGLLASLNDGDAEQARQAAQGLLAKCCSFR